MASITLPNTFSANTTILSAEVNSNFTTIYNDYNTSITNVNISASAAIARTKLASPPAMSAHNAAVAISVATATNTDLSFSTMLINVDNMGDTAGRFTINTSGNYAMGAVVRYSANATGIRQIYFEKNADGINRGEAQNTTPSGASVTVLAFSILLPLVAGDYMKLRTYQNSGGNLDAITAVYSPVYAFLIQ